MKRRVAIFLICFTAVILTIRIIYVNKNKHMPHVIEVPQGETVEYSRVDYKIDSAVLWGYDDFFLCNQQYMKHREDYFSNEDTKILVVNIKFDKNPKYYGMEAYTADGIPITYMHAYNWFDIFLYAEMNDEEKIKQTQIITIPYEIYRQNMPDEKWDCVDQMEFRLILGVYPERIELIISDYEVVE